MKKPDKNKQKNKISLSNPPTIPEWYQQGLGDWSNEAIFSRLQDYGLTLDESAFRQEAEEKNEPAELAAIWAERMDRSPGRWEDFFQLAARELWKRFLRERDYWEWFFDDLEDQLEDSVDYRGKKLTEGEVSKLFNFLDRMDRLLLKTSQEENVPLETLGKNLPMRFDFDLLGWLLEIPFELAGDGFVDQAVYVARKFSFVDPGNLLGDLGYILAKAGRCSEALEQVENNLKNLSDDPWVIIKAGDAWDLCGDSERAEKLYLQALDMTENQYDRDGVIERLIPLYEKMGKEEEIKALEQKKLSKEILREQGERLTGRSELQVIRQAPKVGRNDPCPCGSGKKYKKCCLGKDGY